MRSNQGLDNQILCNAHTLNFSDGVCVCMYACMRAYVHA